MELIFNEPILHQWEPSIERDDGGDDVLRLPEYNWKEISNSHRHEERKSCSKPAWIFKTDFGSE